MKVKLGVVTVVAVRQANAELDIAEEVGIVMASAASSVAKEEDGVVVVQKCRLH